MESRNEEWDKFVAGCCGIVMVPLFFGGLLYGIVKAVKFFWSL
jgi:hypothetical protein